jgi:hypothetical protein
MARQPTVLISVVLGIGCLVLLFVMLVNRKTGQSLAENRTGPSMSVKRMPNCEWLIAGC